MLADEKAAASEKSLTAEKTSFGEARFSPLEAEMEAAEKLDLATCRAAELEQAIRLSNSH